MSNCFPKHLQHFTFLAATYEGPNFSTSSPILVTVRLFYYSHPSEYEVLFYCGLDDMTFHLNNNLKKITSISGVIWCTFWYTFWYYVLLTYLTYDIKCYY